MRPIGRAVEALGLVPRAHRFKRQDVADRDMLDVLTRRYGMRPHTALFLVTIGRDGAPQAVELLHRISHRHRIGWFGEAP